MNPIAVLIVVAVALLLVLWHQRKTRKEVADIKAAAEKNAAAARADVQRFAVLLNNKIDDALYVKKPRIQPVPRPEAPKPEPAKADAPKPEAAKDNKEADKHA